MSEPVKTVLLAPHHDDETLFAAFLAIRHQADLVVCFRGDQQAKRGLPITALDRERETDAAWRILRPGGSWHQWPFSDAAPAWAALEERVAALADEYDHVIAPCPEAGGHEQHNRVGEIARRHFGRSRATLYLTYRRGESRSRWGTEVEPQHPDWIALKLRALACYESQIREPTCRPWFLDGLREYVA